MGFVQLFLGPPMGFVQLLLLSGLATVAVSDTAVEVPSAHIMVGGYMHQPTVSAEATAAAEVPPVSATDSRSGAVCYLTSRMNHT